MKKFALMLLGIVLGAAAFSIPAQAVGADRAEPKGPNCYVGLEGFTFSSYDGCVNYYLGMAGWGGTTKGLVDAFLTAEQNTLSVSGAKGYSLTYTAEQASLYWTVPLQITPDQNCPQPAYWVSWWLVPLGTNLEPGKYVINFTWDLSHPITDGYQACIGYPNGQNIYNGYLSADIVTFTVKP